MLCNLSPCSAIACRRAYSASPSLKIASQATRSHGRLIKSTARTGRVLEPREASWKPDVSTLQSTDPCQLSKARTPLPGDNNELGRQCLDPDKVDGWPALPMPLSRQGYSPFQSLANSAHGIICALEHEACQVKI